MSACAMEFQTKAGHAKDDMKDSDEKGLQACINFAVFNPFGIINDPRDLERDITTQIVQRFKQ